MSYALEVVRVRPFRVGNVVAASFQVFARAWWNLLLLAAAPLAVQYGLDSVIFSRMLAATLQTRGYANGLITDQFLRQSLAFVFNTFAGGMSIFGAYQVLLGREFSLAESFSRGARRFPPLACALVLSWLIVALLSLLLIIPGIVAFFAFSSVAPICVVERRGPIGSLSRSAALTRGSRWRLLGLYVVVGIPLLIVCVLIARILTAFLFDANFKMEAYVTGAMVFSFAAWPATIIYSAFWSALSVVTYRDLRIAREGIGVDAVADVFT